MAKAPAARKTSVVVMEEAPAEPAGATGQTRDLALVALRQGGGTVRELATRVRMNTDKGYQRIYWALRVLVKEGTVVKDGTRYRLVKAHGEAA